MSHPDHLSGRCLCGDIRFTVSGPVARPTACHCGQCRRQSGHVWASAMAPRENLTITGEPRWFSASDQARRGFCPRCGSFLFWEENGAPNISFALGALDAPTGLRLEEHIFFADKGDYYDIADGVPERP